MAIGTFNYPPIQPTERSTPLVYLSLLYSSIIIIIIIIIRWFHLLD